MNWHILPINDIQEHEELSTCHCEPKAELIEGGILIIHNSYDGREILEQVNTILNG